MGDAGGSGGDKKAQIDLACSTAENFSKLFYDKMDNKRHTIAKMYLETATASWNGNKVDGAVDIQKFYLDKLPKTEHLIMSVDAQPVGSAFVGAQTTILVSVAGHVSFQVGTMKLDKFLVLYQVILNCSFFNQWETCRM